MFDLMLQRVGKGHHIFANRYYIVETRITLFVEKGFSLYWHSQSQQKKSPSLTEDSMPATQRNQVEQT